MHVCEFVSVSVSLSLTHTHPTSLPTHPHTQALLAERGNFGAAEGQIRIVKQEKVPAVMDNDGHIAVDGATGELLTKPHGHGDVHFLLHDSGIAQGWKDRGLEWVVLFQDTNGLVFRSMLATLGVSATRNFKMNFMTAPRKAQAAVGAIAKLEGAGGRTMTVNVEYNQLEPLLKATPGFEDGDVNAADGWSPFPGNMNQLILALHPYLATLQRTNGMVPEFVNPK